MASPSDSKQHGGNENYPAGIIASVAPDGPSGIIASVQPTPNGIVLQPPAKHMVAHMNEKSKTEPVAIPPAPETTNASKSSSKGSFFSSLFCCFGRQTDDKVYEIPSKQTDSSRKSAATGSKEEKKYLLKPLLSEDTGKKCLVLDLDETLVHSSFKPVSHADFVIPVEIDNQIHNVYVLKRPGVDLFLQRLGPQFEVVVFTASLSKYADPVLDVLDKYKVVKHRLFREACLHHKGNYVKDLSLLGRELKDVIIIDNSPASYIFHPTNAIPISSWFNDPNDTELVDLIPFLEDLKLVENVMVVLDNSNEE